MNTEENILAIYITLMKIVNVFTIICKWTSSFRYEIITSKKKIYEIFAFTDK